ncbi:MAG TPA: hypothetical protein VEG42_05535, partial [Thermoplasmata archaeon]|nr:hypothetical protein [Thermoplasmata archaeon]
MRPGLVILGSVIAILGGGLVLTLFFFSGGPSTSTHFTSDIPAISPHAPYSTVFSRSVTSKATIGLTWSTSGPANVTLTPAA